MRLLKTAAAVAMTAGEGLIRFGNGSVLAGKGLKTLSKFLLDLSALF